MAYLYENKELVYEKQMKALKKRIILVNLTIFLANFLSTLILIFNKMPLLDYLQLIIPVFILNLVISYAMVINRDSHQQLYLAMYTSIIGIIIVVVNIFLIVQTPATYMLLYLAIAIISIYNDKKAVSIGYLIILVFGTIIHFKHTQYIIGYQNLNGYLSPLLYEGLLILTLIVQTARIFYNEAEIDLLYDELETRKQVELKYHTTLFRIWEENQSLLMETEQYIDEETKERLSKYIELFNSQFYIRDDLNEKMDLFLKLQQLKHPKKVVGPGLMGYQMKNEMNQFDEMSLYKQSKLLSLIIATKHLMKEDESIESIKNFDYLFMNPDMSIEIKMIGFILLYEQLRLSTEYADGLSHEAIVAFFSRVESYEFIDKEIVEFFIENNELFAAIFENRDEIDEEEVQNIENDEAVSENSIE